jgi:hypothetical protein
VNFLSVVFFPLVSPLIIKKNIFTDGFTNEKEAQKKLFASFRRYFPWKNTVCNSVGNYLKIF